MKSLIDVISENSIQLLVHLAEIQLKATYFNYFLTTGTTIIVSYMCLFRIKQTDTEKRKILSPKEDNR